MDEEDSKAVFYHVSNCAAPTHIYDRDRLHRPIQSTLYRGWTSSFAPLIICLAMCGQYLPLLSMDILSKVSQKILKLIYGVVKGVIPRVSARKGYQYKTFQCPCPVPANTNGVYELIYSISTAQHCDRAIGINSCWLGKGPRINYGYASQIISLAIHLQAFRTYSPRLLLISAENLRKLASAALLGSLPGSPDSPAPPRHARYKRPASAVLLREEAGIKISMRVSIPCFYWDCWSRIAEIQKPYS